MYADGVQTMLAFYIGLPLPKCTVKISKLKSVLAIMQVVWQGPSLTRRKSLFVLSMRASYKDIYCLELRTDLRSKTVLVVDADAEVCLLYLLIEQTNMYRKTRVVFGLADRHLWSRERYILTFNFICGHYHIFF